MNRIKELRMSKHLTQEALGNILNVQKAAISKYETGRAEPSMDILRKMTDFFNVSVDYILGLSIIPHASVPPSPVTHLSLLPQEKELLHKYRELDPRGKQAVLDTVNREYSYIVPKTEDTAT